MKSSGSFRDPKNGLCTVRIEVVLHVQSFAVVMVPICDPWVFHNTMPPVHPGMIGRVRIVRFQDLSVAVGVPSEHLGLLHDYPLCAVSGRKEELIEVHIVELFAECWPSGIAVRRSMLAGTSKLIRVAERAPLRATHQTPTIAHLIAWVLAKGFSLKLP